MKLSKREKILVSIFVALIILLPYLHYIIMPQITKFRALQAQVSTYESTLHESSMLIGSEEEVDATHRALNLALQEYRKQYLLPLEQGSILILLNDIISSSEINIDSIGFVEFKERRLGDMLVDGYSVNLPFSGTYESLLKFLELIRTNEKRMVIKSLDLSQREGSIVNGQVVIDFYELVDDPTIDLSDESSSAIYRYLGNAIQRFNPFAQFEGYINEYIDVEQAVQNRPESPTSQPPTSSVGLSQSNGSNREDTQIELLYGFESNNAFFLGEPRDVIGHITLDSNSQQGQYSLRLTYDFLRPRQGSIANIVFEGTPLRIDRQPNQLRLSVYAFERGAHRIGIVLRDSNGKQHKIYLAQTIDWHGWKTLEANVPLEVAYPAIVERVIVEGVNYDSQTKGMFLFDQLEGIFPKLITYPNSYQTTAGVSNRQYTVKAGDTLYSISQTFYGDYMHRHLILHRNRIPNGELYVGQTLNIPEIDRDYFSSQGLMPYVVQPGDTIFSITRQFYDDPSKQYEIMEHNGIPNPHYIEVGQLLLIPKH